MVCCIWLFMLLILGISGYVCSLCFHHYTAKLNCTSSEKVFITHCISFLVLEVWLWFILYIKTKCLLGSLSLAVQPPSLIWNDWHEGTLDNVFQWKLCNCLCQWAGVDKKNPTLPPPPKKKIQWQPLIKCHFGCK